MILSLHKKKNGNIAYCKIERNLNDIYFGEVSPKELEDIDKFGIEAVALSDTAPIDLKNIAAKLAKDANVPLEFIEHTEALMTANWLNLGNDSLNEIAFPHIAFIDADHSTSIHIVDSPTKHRVIGSIKNNSLAKYLNELESMMNVENLETAANLGDETSKIFSGDIDLEENEVFDMMKKIFNDAIEQLKLIPIYTTGKEDVDKKMKEFAIADFAASFQEALVKYLIIRIFDAAGNTGISLVTLSGSFSQNSRFREMSVRMASNVKYDVRFPEPGHYENPAIAIAARAFLNKYGQIEI